MSPHEPGGDEDDQQADDLDVEAMFAGIVAGWGEDVPVADQVAREERNQPKPDPEPPAEDDVPVRAELVGVTGPRDYAGAPEREDDGRFVPPEPPPLPKGDLIGRLAWAGLLGCPVLLIVLAVIWRPIPRNLLLALLAGTIAGFVVLIARLPRDRSDDDDGAVV